MLISRVGGYYNTLDTCLQFEGYYKQDPKFDLFCQTTEICNNCFTFTMPKGDLQLAIRMCCGFRCQLVGLLKK